MEDPEPSPVLKAAMAQYGIICCKFCSQQAQEKYHGTIGYIWHKDTAGACIFGELGKVN
jgi:hypothetical protein